MRSLLKACAVLAMAVLAAPSAYAQLDSNQAQVQLNANLAESLTVTAAPGAVNFALAAAGVAPGSSQIGVTTTWVLNGGRTNVSLYAYFSSAVALTDGAGNNIPTSSVSGSVDGGGFSTFTGGAGPFGVNSVQMFSQAINNANRNSSRASTLDLQIDTTGLNLPASTYTGVLNIQARAI